MNRLIPRANSKTIPFHRLFALACLSSALGSCSGGGDGNAVADASFNFPKTSLDSAVNVVTPATDASGDVYVGGIFTSFQDAGLSRIGRFNADGTRDSVFRIGSGFDSGVHVIVPALDTTGDIYVGGDFTQYDGSGSNRIIRLNTNGSVDAGFDVQAGFNNRVEAIAPALDFSGDVYVGGSFTSYAGSGSSRIIRLNLNGTPDAGFNTGTGFNGGVCSIVPATDASGDVYVGGTFTSYNGTGANRIIRLNSNGSVDAAFMVATGFDSGVNVLAAATDSSGDVYVGGRFLNYDGMPASRIIRLNPDGTRDAGFNVGAGFDNEVLEITPATDASGDVYVGGIFGNYQGTASSRLIRINADGSPDLTFDVGIGLNGRVHSIATATGVSGKVFLGGQFSAYDGASSSFIASINTNGSPDLSFDVPTGGGFNSSISTIVPQADGSGDLYLGGFFSTYTGVVSNRLIRLSARGAFDDGFNIGGGFANAVQAIALANDSSGDVYVGGSIAGAISRLNDDGSTDAAFNVGSGFNGAVFDLVVADDSSGSVYASGFFTSYKSINSNYIIRLQPNGDIDTGFNIGTGLDNRARALALATDGSGDVYVGGQFGMYNGGVANRIIRLNATGSVDLGFNVGAGFDGDVLSIVPATDGSGKLYVGGSFANYAGSGSNRIIRLDASGMIDPGFNVGSGFNGNVESIALATDASGDVYVGGAFTSFNGNQANSLVRLNPDGSLDAGFNNGAGFDGVVRTIAIGNDGFGDVYVGGDFLNYDGTSAVRAVALNDNGSLD